MITLYHAPKSRSTRMIFLLEEIGAPYEIKIVTIRRGDGSGAADIHNPHPHAKVPAIRHGNEIVFESSAIVAYLTDAFRKSASRPNRASRAAVPISPCWPITATCWNRPFSLNSSRWRCRAAPQAGWRWRKSCPYRQDPDRPALYRGRKIHRRRHSLRHHLRHVRAEPHDAQAGVGGSLCEALPGAARLCTGHGEGRPGLK